MEYQEEITITFDEADPAGILFFGRFFNLAHRLIESFVRASGISWKNWYDHPEWAVPIRHSNADYQKPLMVGETYMAKLNVQKLGDSSVTFGIYFYDGDTVCAHITTTHVFITKPDMKKRSIPDEIREKLKPYCA